MKLTYEELSKKPRTFKSFTGLSPDEFENIVSAFESAYEAHLDEEDSKRSRPRQRRRGGGLRSGIDTIRDKLLFILIYFKIYPIQEVQGTFFEMSQPQANYWIHLLTPILEKGLGKRMELPARKPADLKTALEANDGLEFIIDGTERPIQRPKKDKDKQKKYFSGKKKRHTVKNNLISDRKSKKIKGLSQTVEGKKHDKALMDEWGIDFPDGSEIWKDSGFQGYEPEGIKTHQPKKKPKGVDLTPEEKERNKFISKVRVGVEHVIGSVKIFHIVKDIYRNHKKGFEDLIMEISCGLHNFKLDCSLS